MSSAELAIITPEMVQLDFTLAAPGRRLIAFCIDLLLIGLALLVLSLGIGVLFGLAGNAALGWAFLLFASFVVRTFYFIAFELRGRGRTPGKRLLGLQVIAGDGGPLGPGMVFARNLTREMELFLPLIVLLAPQAVMPGAPSWVVAATIVWVLALVLLPFFNRNRARLGDLVAGTVVVVEPRSILLEDLVAETAATAATSPATAQYQFSNRQLDLYGIRELQILEQVLRRQSTPNDQELIDLICRKIINKIGWHEPPIQVDSERFLRAFYAAQRARLEHKMLMGKRQEQKVRGRVRPGGV